jgi:hypothetical protein
MEVPVERCNNDLAAVATEGAVDAAHVPFLHKRRIQAG